MQKRNTRSGRAEAAHATIRMNRPPADRAADPTPLRLRINGYLAELHLWPPGAFDESDFGSIPHDAQRHPSGVWATLRMAE